MYFEQIPARFTLFFMVYGGTALVALLACIYLWLRRVSIFAPAITPPVAVRRWTAIFFAFVFLGHVWWELFYIFSGEMYSVMCMVFAVLDSLALLTTLPGMLFAMLQDRKRPVWPIVLSTIPYAVLTMLHFFYPHGYFIELSIAYICLVYVFFSIYMVFEVRKYGRWLRDNYADLEHKEVWVSHLLVLVILMIIISDGFLSQHIIASTFVQLIELALIIFLIWRVDTLPLLESTPAEPQPPLELVGLLKREQVSQQLAIPSNIEQLLEDHCVATKLYLQHDLTLDQLAHIIGTNRLYLSLFFSRSGITYNEYINDLRINHFMDLYRKSVEAKQPILAKQLAIDSGYRNYGTFNHAFKQRMGQSVTVWMRNKHEE